MKKVLASSVVVLMVLFLSAGFGLAGKGKGKGNGVSGGGGGTPIHDIFAGVSFDYSGEVISYVQGQGMVISTVSENVIIYGIGPVRYWDSLDPPVVRPVVGDTIYVSGYKVDYNGVDRNIAVIITVGGVEVPLRDLETGAALWRGSGGKSN